MTVYRQHLAGTTYQFDGMVDLLAKATPLRSDDELSGCAASSDAERAAAQWALADLPMDNFLEQQVVPYDADEVTRLIIDSHDPSAFRAIRHDLADRSDHFRRESRGQSGQGSGGIGSGDDVQQPISKAADGEMGNGTEGRSVVGVDDQPGDLIGVVGHHLLFEEVVHREIGQRPLRGGAFGIGLAAQPDNSSPDRSGVALASRSTMPSNW